MGADSTPTAAPTARPAPSNGPSYDADIAAMLGMLAHIDDTLLPHLEMLVSQARAAGNGPAVLAALNTAMDQVTTARDQVQQALQVVCKANEKVHQAYADAANQAATAKSYFLDG